MKRDCANGPEKSTHMFIVRNFYLTAGPVTLQVMNCPNTPIQVTPPSGSNTIPVVWSQPFALTNAGDQADILSQTHAPGDLFNIPSVTQVTYVFQASDAMEVCTFEVRVGKEVITSNFYVRYKKIYICLA